MKKEKQSVDTNVNTFCSTCLQVKPKSDYGEYKMHA